MNTNRWFSVDIEPEECEWGYWILFKDGEKPWRYWSWPSFDVQESGYMWAYATPPEIPEFKPKLRQGELVAARNNKSHATWVYMDYHPSMENAYDEIRRPTNKELDKMGLMRKPSVAAMREAIETTKHSNGGFLDAAILLKVLIGSSE